MALEFELNQVRDSKVTGVILIGIGVNSITYLPFILTLKKGERCFLVIKRKRQKGG